MEGGKGVMELSAVELHHKQFSMRWRGFDPREVELFLQQTAETIHATKMEAARLQAALEEQQKELSAYKEREKAIRNVLLNAHKNAEQLKANAEKEARLIVAEAELKAEKILQGAHQRLAQLQEEIAELKGYRIQLESRLRSTIETYRQLLGTEKEEETESGMEGRVKVINR